MAIKSGEELSKQFGFLYRNYFPARGCFYNGKDENGLYDEEVAKKWYNERQKYMKEVEIIRPPKKIVKIKIPIGKDKDVEEDLEFALWLSKVKIEPKLGYILDTLLDDYYYGIDGYFYVREVKRTTNKEDSDVVFSMREVLNGWFRINPIQVRTTTDKDTQAIKFIDWNIGSNVTDVPFRYQGKDYKTNMFGLYGGNFRQTLFPNSDFDGHTLMPWQREVHLGMGNVTIVKAPRSGGKSLYATHLCALHLFKDLNMPHEYDRPFLIVYGGLSKEANMQVIDYLKDMAKRITTNKNILSFNKAEMTLTLFDGHNERKVKFVSQGQEGQGFRGLRPTLVILDEASRLKKSMYDVAAGTAEAPVFIISTTNQDDERNWFEDMYKEAVARQRLYKPVDELIKEIWIKYGFHKVRDITDLNKLIKRGDIKKAKDELLQQRSMVAFKFNIYDVTYLTPEEIQMQIDKYAGDEEACNAELFNEITSNRTLFSADGLMVSSIPYEFDYVSLGYDHAESRDNPAVVAVGYRDGKCYVYHSEILDKDDVRVRYESMEAAYRDALSRAPNVVWGGDFSNGGKTLLREFEMYIDTPKYPWILTSAKNDEIKKQRPFHYIGKKQMERISRDEYFRAGIILFDEVLDVEGGLIEEMSNFKGSGTTATQGQKGRKDDQVNAFMVALVGLYMEVFKSAKKNNIVAGNKLEARRIKNLAIQKKEAYLEYKKAVVNYKNNFR